MKALEEYLSKNDPEGFGCACSPEYKCGPCRAYDSQQPLREVLASVKPAGQEGGRAAMSRNMLHISKIEDFKLWLDSEGIQHRPGKGAFQVLQVCKDGKHWNCIYKRHEMPEHYTADRHIDPLVVKFCRQRKPATDQQNGDSSHE